MVGGGAGGAHMGSAEKANKVKSLLASYYDLDDAEETSNSLFDTPRSVCLGDKDGGGGGGGGGCVMLRARAGGRARLAVAASRAYAAPTCHKQVCVAPSHTPSPLKHLLTGTRPHLEVARHCRPAFCPHLAPAAPMQRPSTPRTLTPKPT